MTTPTKMRQSSVDATIITADGANAFTGDQSLGGNKLTNVADPASAQDAATKAYVDGATAGLPGGSNKDVQYNNSGALGGIASNVTTTRKFLEQHGDGVNPNTAAPDTLQADDIPATLNGVNVSQAFALSGYISPAQITGNVNNYNPTNLAIASGLRLYTDASHNLTGIVAPATDGRILPIANVGSFNLVLKSQDSGSSAANRFAFPADLTLTPNTLIFLQYDATTARWRALGGSSGGGSITPSDTVSDETTYGLSPAAGSATEYSRGDHTHGTPSLGFPQRTDSESFVGQTADIATTNFIIDTLQATYRISYYLVVTTADAAAGAITLTFTWTDPVTGRTINETSLLLTSTGYLAGSEIVFLNSGNLTYAVSHTGIFGTAQYELHLALESLG